MPKRPTSLPYVALAVAILGLACGGAAAPTATVAPATPAAAGATVRAPTAVATATAGPAVAPTAVPVAAAKAAGKVTVIMPGVLSTYSGDLDPAFWIGGSRGLYRVIYEPLAYTNPRDPTGRDYLSPILATGWQVSADARAWTIQLRKGVKFHNGEDFNAQVMAKNIQRYNGIGGAPEMRDNMAAYEFPDTHTLVLQLKNPDLGLLGRMAHHMRAAYPVPASYVDKFAKEVPSREIREHPIGTGPYKFVSMDKEADALVMEAWDEWGGYWGFKPTVKTVKLLGIPEATTRMAMMATGEADLSQFLPGPYLKEARGFTVKQYVSVRTNWSYFLRVNNPDSPYSKVKVRQALNYAVDKEAIIKAVLAGAGIPVGQNISPVQFGYNPEVKPYPYDPQKARQLLAEAGYPDGFDGGRTISTDSQTADIDLSIADYFSKVGVRVEVRRGDSAIIGPRMRQPIHNLDSDYVMYTSASSLGGEADYRIWFALTSMGNWAYSRDPELDSLYVQSTRASNQREREALVQKAALLSHDQAYLLFLWTNQSVYGWGPRIADWTFTPGEDVFDNAQSIRLK